MAKAFVFFLIKIISPIMPVNYTWLNKRCHRPTLLWYPGWSQVMWLPPSRGCISIANQKMQNVL